MRYGRPMVALSSLHALPRPMWGDSQHLPDGSVGDSSSRAEHRNRARSDASATAAILRGSED